MRLGVNARLAIKQLAEKKHTTAKELLVLARRNDPFYVGSKSQYKNAEWAVKLYQLYNPCGKVHLRRLHYFALARPEHTKPDGRVYRNTSTDWKFLVYAAKFARYLELLPYEAFVDRRSRFETDRGPGRAEQTRNPKSVIGEISQKVVNSYLRVLLDSVMPVHIEIWMEKSTAADLIEPIAKKYNFNVIVSMGEISLTAVWQFVRRIESLDKPVRVFYISDFDPSGENMPISASRKIEFLIRQHKLRGKVDVKLKPIILTGGQCRSFKLPGIPLAEKFRKNSSFKKYHGGEASELHALEAASPGYICRFVESSISQYVDVSVVAAAQRIFDKVAGELSERAVEMVRGDSGLASLLKTIEKLFAGSKGCGGRSGGPWLFDSGRSYMTQLAAYELQRLR